MSESKKEIKGGFIAVTRSLRDHCVVGFGSEGRYSKAEAWQDLIMECRYCSGRAMNKGRATMLRPGELIGGISWLARRWNWTPKTVRWFLSQLEREGMIALLTLNSDGERMPSKSGNRGGNQANIISICNYSSYQTTHNDERQPNGQPNGNHAATEGQPHGNNLRKEQGNNNTPPTPSKGEPKASRKCAMPDDWSPNLEWVRQRWNATDRQLSEQSERFREYHASRGSLMKNWDAAWRTWWLNGFHRIPKKAETNGHGHALAKESELDAAFDHARRVLGI